ncbi:hypothetical protein AGMMS49521_3320 [Campylobacterota bacterium]|nr:hypothetical protein AGMMS49521_3320 [Campylobacterota bacterium]
MKKVYLISIALSFVLAIAGCGGGSENSDDYLSGKRIGGEGDESYGGVGVGSTPPARPDGESLFPPSIPLDAVAALKDKGGAAPEVK